MSWVEQIGSPVLLNVLLLDLSAPAPALAREDKVVKALGVLSGGQSCCGGKERMRETSPFTENCWDNSVAENLPQDRFLLI